MIIVTRPSSAPVAALWDVMADLDRWADWLPTVDAIRAVDPGRPPGVGAAYVLDQPRLRRATWTITAWSPGHGFRWESSSPGLRTEARHSLEAGPDGTTTIDLRMAWAGLLAAPVGALLGSMTRSYVEREAAALDATASTRSST